ncbi:hypothetical protein B0H11DRAFT_2307769 [Mycena galericulata]|nr:hypothetical protein B0H11DRAFT_2307769 [Mycena galericulata]
MTLFHSHIDHRKTSTTSIPAMAHSYAETSSPESWYYENTVPRAAQDTALYRDSQIHSPYSQSPQMDANLGLLPYTPPFSPMQPRVAGFTFQPTTSLTAPQTKPWPGPVQPQIYDAASVPASPGWPLMTLEPFDSNSWNDMIMSALEVDTAPSPSSSQNTLPSPLSFRYLLPCPSPSPSLSSGRLSPASSTASSSQRSSVESSSKGPKTCSHCAATATPALAARPRNAPPPLKMRPAALIAADQADDDDDDLAPGAPECSHCHTHRTSVWRRSKSGAKLCNACGVYARLRGRDRPLSLKRNRIRPRCKHPK